MQAKTKTAKKAIKDEQLINQFNKMLGLGEPDTDVVIPKYLSILKNANEVVDILKTFHSSAFAECFYELFPVGFDEIKKFIESAKVELVSYELEKNDQIISGAMLREANKNPELLMKLMSQANCEYKTEKLGDRYKSLKECTTIKEMIMIARNLQQELLMEKKRTDSVSHNLEVKNNLSADFIKNTVGDYLCLFNFSTLDFKQILYSESMDDKLQDYMLMVLKLIHGRCIEIVKCVTSPDINIEEFTEVLIGNIDKIEKHIPRCELAFQKIKESTTMLKSNFGEYYKDFISSQNSNPGIIIENFVIDVSKANSASPELASQFRKIVQFYQQHITNKKIKDNNLMHFIDAVSANLDILDDRMNKHKKKD